MLAGTVAFTIGAFIGFGAYWIILDARESKRDRALRAHKAEIRPNRYLLDEEGRPE